MSYFVYILGSSRPTLYIGMTSNIPDRIKQHKTGYRKRFTKKYRVDKLLYFEKFKTVSEALRRERQLKHWKRDWKLSLIKKENPELKDLSGQQ